MIRILYKRFVIFAAAAFFLGMGIVWAVHRPGEAHEPARAFTVMTFNVGDAGRQAFPAAATAACIMAGGRPDILFLQEAPNGKTGAELLGALAYPYGSGAQEGTGKLGGLRMLSVYRITETRQIPLPSHGKGAGALCAVVNMDGAKVLACSVHLDEVAPKTRSPKGEVRFTIRETFDILWTEFFTDTVRTVCARALTHELSDDIADMPVILAGDFNTVPGARTVRHIEDLFQDVLWPGWDYLTGTYHKIAFPIEPRIDYIFVSDQLTVDHARVVRKSVGDHYPVMARMRLISDS